MAGDVKNYPGGKPIVILGTNGTDLYGITVDASGHVQVDVLSNALPTGAATEATLADIKTAAQLIDDLRNALGSVATDLVRVEAKGGDKIFSFESIVEERLLDAALPDGDSSIDGTVVPVGKIWKITHLAATYVGTPPTKITAVALGLAGGLVLGDQLAPVSDAWYTWDGDVYLQVGDCIRVSVEGATAGDTLICDYAGLQMDAP